MLWADRIHDAQARVELSCHFLRLDEVVQGLTAHNDRNPPRREMNERDTVISNMVHELGVEPTNLKDKRSVVLSLPVADAFYGLSNRTICACNDRFLLQGLNYTVPRLQAWLASWHNVAVSTIISRGTTCDWLGWLYCGFAISLLL